MKFSANVSYTITFAGDSDLKVELPVIRRTAKSLWAKVNGEVKRMKIYTYNGVEYVRPYGTYSMNPTAQADAPFAVKPEPQTVGDTTTPEAVAFILHGTDSGRVFHQGNTGPETSGCLKLDDAYTEPQDQAAEMVASGHVEDYEAALELAGGDYSPVRFWYQEQALQSLPRLGRKGQRRPVVISLPMGAGKIEANAR